MALLFFKLLVMKMTTLLHAFQSIFSTSMEVRSKQVVWTHQPLLQASKNIDPAIYFWSAEIIRCQITMQQITHQIDVLNHSKRSCLSWCVRACIIVLKDESPSTIGFPEFSEHFWQTNAGVRSVPIIAVRTPKW